MDTNLLVDKIQTIENILINNEGKNDNIIKFALKEIKSMIINNNNSKDNLKDSEIKRLNKIIEEKDIKINELTNELNSLKMNNNKNKINENVIIGCKHFKKCNVYVKCSYCNDFFPCYLCHNNIQKHSFVVNNINKCRFCNTIYNNEFLFCPGCKTEKNLSS